MPGHVPRPARRFSWTAIVLLTRLSWAFIVRIEIDLADVEFTRRKNPVRLNSDYAIGIQYMYELSGAGCSNKDALESCAKMSRLSFLLTATLTAAAPTKRALDTAALATQYFGNDPAWYQDRIPFFACSDQQTQDVYYYRWKIFRAHQRDLGERGYVSTEFLDDVGWQLEPWATLNDATGFHLNEGRWLRDRRFADNYIQHMYEGGGNDRHFTDWMADSVYQRFQVDGDADFLTAQLSYMVDLYNQWNDSFDATKGLYWREPLADATEYTISSIDASGGQDGFTGGQAFRPSINSYMWANARAIARVANLAVEDEIASDYTQRAATLKQTFQDTIWNTTLEHFIDRYGITNEYVTYWDPIRGRELVGLVPWMFGMPDDNATYSAAWSHLLDPNELHGPNGMRTNEPSYEYYMRQYRYDAATGLRECQWNGPVWPYQTTQVLTGMANLLNDYDQNVVSASDYVSELKRYTQLHYINASLDLQEDYEPDKTGPIVGLPRSHHYFHSGYNDLIINGLVGIRPQADNTIEINPLIDADITSFRLQNIIYHGHEVAVEWDAAGDGLNLEIDGQVVASSPTISKLTANLTSVPAPAITGKTAKSIQLVRAEYPLGSASSGNDTENVHDAIDGRIWFFPELPNGWNSNATGDDSQQWYAIDFGNETSISSVELAFFVDDVEYALPVGYALQQNVNGTWTDFWAGGPELVANGVTELEGDIVTTSQVRLLFTQAAGMRTRLVEFKVF